MFMAVNARSLLLLFSFTPKMKRGLLWKTTKYCKTWNSRNNNNFLYSRPLGSLSGHRFYSKFSYWNVFWWTSSFKKALETTKNWAPNLLLIGHPNCPRDTSTVVVHVDNNLISYRFKGSFLCPLIRKTGHYYTVLSNELGKKTFFSVSIGTRHKKVLKTNFSFLCFNFKCFKFF